MLSIATRVARNVVPHETHTAIQAQYARLSCLGEESDAGLKVSAEAEAHNPAAAAAQSWVAAAAYSPQAAAA